MRRSCTTRPMRVGSWILVAAFGFACGDDTESPSFTACGGQLVGRWQFSSAAPTAALDGCPADASAGGFLIFNQSPSRVSVNLELGAWIPPGGSACGEKKQNGLYWRTSGNTFCTAVLEADLDAACAGNPPTSDPWAGVGEYCVQGTSLEIKSSSLFGLQGEALMKLGPMP